MPLGDTGLWRSTMTPESRYESPYDRLQPKKPSLWQSLTPWKEEKGETFLSGVSDVFRSVGTPFAAPFLIGGMSPQEKAAYEQEKQQNWWKAHFGRESTLGQQYEQMPLWGQLLAEAPAFLLGGGLAGAGIKGLAGAAAKTGVKGGLAQVGRAALSPLGGGAQQIFKQAGKTGGLAGRAAQAISAPAAGLEKGTQLALKGAGKALSPVTKPLGAAIGRAIAPIVGPKFVSGRVVLPSGIEIEATMQQDWRRRLAQMAGRYAPLRKIVETVGGPRALVNVESKELQDITLKELVKHQVVMSQRHDVQGLLLPKLQVYDDPIKLLRLNEFGQVGAVQPLRRGTSTTLTDVIENPQNYRWLDKTAKKYVDDVQDVVNEMMALAQKEGIKVPDRFIFHRMVKGKTTPAGYVDSEFGSRFEAERRFKTQAEGVKTGKIDYDFNPNTSVSATINHYMKKIADERLRKEIKKVAIRTEKGRLKYKPTDTFVEKRTLISPAFRDRAGRPLIFHKDVINTAEKYLGDQGNAWLKSMAHVSGTGRLLVAAMDFSAPFIQGLPILGRRPDVWAKATLKHYGFAKDPRALYRYLESPVEKQIRMERFANGASSQSFEFYQALPDVQRVVAKIPKVGEKVAKGIQQTYGRAEAAFTGFGELARNEMWKALRRPNMSQGELRELATVLDRMTGVMSTEALGIGMSQRQFENAFLFFAPRYTRAGLKLFTDLFSGGLTGKMARQSLGQLAAGGMAMYMGITSAMGQEAKLDPTKGDFMTIEIGGDKIGIGGMITSIARFGADLVQTAAENPMDLIQPFKDKRLNRWDNPFIRFMYSKSAPLTGLTVGTAVENADYFGKPLENIEDWSKFLADKITPIALQRVAPWSGEQPSAAGAAAEIAGMRTFPAKIPKSPAAAQRAAYQEIEERIWGMLSPEYKKIREQIEKLEKENPLEARRLLARYPNIVMARQRIATEKKRWKLTQGVTSQASSFKLGGGI